MDDSRTCQRCGKEYQGGGYKFCSKECMLGKGECKKCGKGFQREFAGQRFCSGCFDKAESKVCPGCGKAFESRYGQVYCSKGCYESARARTPDVCPQCGKEVPKSRKYCSDECKWRARGTIRVCQRCGREFHKASNGKVPKYCSNECAHKAQVKREDRICLQCGKVFHPHSMAQGLFCSHQCFGLSVKKEGFTQVCQQCGREFQSAYEGRRFCSQGCATAKAKSDALGFEAQFVRSLRWMNALSVRMGEAEGRRRRCIVCGVEFVARNTRGRICSDECKRVYDNARKDKRIIRSDRRPDYTITLPALYMRDGGVCQACGKALTFDCGFNSDDYPSIDHIIPLAKGGLHRWYNVQLMCRGCNWRKRDAMPEKRVDPQTKLDAFAVG